MKRYFVINGGDELVKYMTPIYTEISYLCMSPRVILVQKGSKFYTAEVKRTSFDFVPDTFKEISPEVYSALCDGNIIKANAVKYNSYTGSLESGKEVQILELLDENMGKFLVSVDFNNRAESNNFDVPTWFGEELRSISDCKYKGISLENKIK